MARQLLVFRAVDKHLQPIATSLGPAGNLGKSLNSLGVVTSIADLQKAHLRPGHLRLSVEWESSFAHFALFASVRHAFRPRSSRHLDPCGVPLPAPAPDQCEGVAPVVCQTLLRPRTTDATRLVASARRSSMEACCIALIFKSCKPQHLSCCFTVLAGRASLHLSTRW